MKIIHCADLHLDSKMETHLTSDKAKIRKAELLQTFTKLVKYAKQNNVEVIMIAGDMFDDNRITDKTKKYVVDLIKDYPQIDFLYLCGNHDENNFVKQLEQIPQNLKSFNSDWQSYCYGDIVITGAELNHVNSNALYSRLDLDENKFNIVMLHGQEVNYNSNDDVEIINLKLLQNKNIDYLALGHIHTYKTGSLGKRGVYAYSGCLEGRGFDEFGQKGFILLDVNPQSFPQLQREFIKFAKRTFYNLNVDISEHITVMEIAKAIDDAILNEPNITNDDFIKITLIGDYTINTQKDITFFENKLNEKYFLARVVDKTKLAININDYQYDVSLKGEFIRTIYQSDLSEEDKGQIIMMGLQALNGEDIE